MLETSLDYSILVFVAVVGLVQAAGTYNNLPRLSFFKQKRAAFMVALLLTGGALAAFFGWNYWAVTGVVEGSEQFGLFVLGSFIALVFTYSMASLIKSRKVKEIAVRFGGYVTTKSVVALSLKKKRNGNGKK
jgi:hypothetical protein